MNEYELHPEAYTDLDEIGQYVGEFSANAAKRVVTEIFEAISALVPFPHQGHRRIDLTLCAFGACMITWSPMRPTSVLDGLLRLCTATVAVV